MNAMQQVQVRVGLPLPGGRLVRAARDRGYPVLFSANAFARTYPKGHEREGFFERFRLPDADQLAGIDAALDSAGYVAAARYGDYRWSVDEYIGLVGSHPWRWWASMDMCCESEVACDRPTRLLRMAATAYLLGRCRAAAAERGLPAPNPVLQGWTPDDYARCASWLPLTEWPTLVGIGSVCRRQVRGPDGNLAVRDALEDVLPSHTSVHLFGVKSTALAQLAQHPRVASVDSMAWDLQARAERRTGRDMAFRIGHMEAWAEKQRRIVDRERRGVGATSRRTLMSPQIHGPLSSREDLALEALALQYADLVISGDVDYRDAVFHAARDGVTLIAILRRDGYRDESFARLNDELVAGLGDRLEEMLEGGGA